MTPTEPTSLTGRFLGIAELLDHHGFYSAELQTSAELLSPAIAEAKKQGNLHYTKKNGITYVARQTAVYSLAADGSVQLSLVPTNLFAALAPAVRKQFEKSTHKDHYVASPEEVREALQGAPTFNVEKMGEKLERLTRCTYKAHHLVPDYNFDAFPRDQTPSNPDFSRLTELLCETNAPYFREMTPGMDALTINFLCPELKYFSGQKAIVVPCSITADTSHHGDGRYSTRAEVSLAGMDLNKRVNIIGNWEI